MIVYDHKKKRENTKRRVKMLRIEHLTKSYDEKKAVDDLSLHINPGEIFGFIGHNGAGKSTTLKSAVGILKYDEGKIFINGASIKDDPLKCKKELAYIPDNPDMYDFMSGIKYLNFIADVFKVPADERMEKIHKYADLFELTDDLAQPISSYSHGMKQKLAVISAWMHDPKLILYAKASVQLILSGIPMLIAVICAVTVVDTAGSVRFLIILTAMMYVIFSAFFNVLLGIKMPLLNWTSEIAPIKQSGGVFIAMFGGWGVCALMGGLYLFIGYNIGAAVYLIIWTLLFAAASFIIIYWLNKRGSVIFSEL